MDDQRAVGPMVFVIDDDPDMLAALEQMLSTAGFQVSTFSSAEDFLQIPIPRGSPACLLVDLRMHGLSGLGLQQRLSQQGTTIPIIFLTGFGNISAAVEAIRCGAVDFLEKPLHRDALLERVKRALDIDEQALVIGKQAADFRTRLESLSRREREVIQFLLQGRSNKEIAASLGIGLPTVSKHRSKALRKLQVRDVLGLIFLEERYKTK
jgi:RNA polymerase sigma factor (sigma-70 family)